MVKKVLDGDTPYLVIVGVVAVVAIVSLVLNGNGSLDGADTVIIRDPVAYIEPDPVIVDNSLRVSKCTDEDSGLNYLDTRNYVQIDVKRYYDFCQGDNLREVFCAANSHRKEVSEKIPCEFGCSRGRCCDQGEFC
jgi:hypothetical protein